MQYSSLDFRRIRLNYGVLAVVLFYCYDVFYMIVNRIVRNGTFSDILCLTAIYGMLLLAVAKKTKRLKADAVIMLLVSALLFVCTYLFMPGYRYALVELPTWNAIDSVFSFSKGLFAYLFFRMLGDKRDLQKALRWSAYFMLLWYFLRILGSLQEGGFSRAMENGRLSSASYDMLLGYRLLYVSAVFGIEMLKQQGMKRWLFGGIGLAAMIALPVFGSRTAVASLIVFWILYVLFCSGKKITRGKIALLVLASACVVILANRSILVLLAAQLEKLGLNSRILDTLLQGEIILDKGRTRMWNGTWEMIVSSPLTGNGVFADRAEFGIYCHQIILEIFLNYGCVLGIVILGGIGYLCVSSMLHKDRECRTLFIVFFSMWIIRLMMSSSYWVNTEFWVSMALAVNMLEQKWKRKRFQMRNG